MNKLSRRAFLRAGTGAAGALVWSGTVGNSYAANAKRRAPGDRLNMAFVGVGGRGEANLREFYGLGEQVVAVCDVDAGRLNHSTVLVKERCPDARKYVDYREMLAKEKDLDAVVVSTPDHMHAAAAIAAMRAGCNVYVEKPLVRTVREARWFETTAKECGAITQMGNNGNGSDAQRRNIELLQSGVLGDVSEIHVSTDRPIWPQGLNRPEGSDPVPEWLSWDNWVGVAPERPFKNGVYHAFNWRGWFDFGTGAMGDIACHSMSFFFRGLRLGEVISAETVKTTEKFKETYPAATTVKLVVKSGMQQSPVTIYWYDGKTKPADEVCPEAVATWGGISVGGTLIKGAKGMYMNGAVCMSGEPKFRGFGQHEATKDIPVTLPRVKGHHWEFAAAIRGEASTFSDIDHSVPLTEAVLLGCVSQQVPGELKWDAAGCRFTNSEAANALLQPHVREGWIIN
ncbi:MAG: Gfo/Idh/MocA family oxidoreductase [Kiritimatiellae bacterium]|nr:Gfo/Idh/MocA family oxidoreductase [Kiritimatiellia bacterium]